MKGRKSLELGEEQMSEMQRAGGMSEEEKENVQDDRRRRKDMDLAGGLQKTAKYRGSSGGELVGLGSCLESWVGLDRNRQRVLIARAHPPPPRLQAD